MDIRKIETFVARNLRRASEAGRWFLVTNGFLAFIGTLTAAFPVTAVVIPAALLQPLRWISITLACALGSALGATAIVELIHHLGIAALEEWFPQLTESTQWQQAMNWVINYSVIGLFLLAASPFPQTPALIFFGLAGHPVGTVFIAIFLGKVLKYGLMAWLSSHFPDRFTRWKTSPPDGDTP